MEDETTNEIRKEGLECPGCGCRHNHVTHTYKVSVSIRGRQEQIIRRRRVCRHCKLPFTSTERVEITEELPKTPNNEDRGYNPYI